MKAETKELISDELGKWASVRKRAKIWWRDDDAISQTAELERLTKLATQYQMPILLAVIPVYADHSLAQYVNSTPWLSAAVHGIAHNDHSVPDQKKTELTINHPDRNIEIILAELKSSVSKIEALFGEPASQILVPPWNRIDEEIASELEALDFKLLSGFADQYFKINLAQLNCQLDLMNWKPEKYGKKTDQVFEELLACLQKARTNDYSPIGILSHHLVHDESAWTACQDLMKFVQENDTLEPYSIQQHLS